MAINRFDSTLPLDFSHLSVEDIRETTIGFGFGSNIPGVCYRVHRQSNGPLWFSSGAGRYDLQKPFGTLNLALSKETALRESLGNTFINAPGIPASELMNRSVTRIDLIGRYRLADFRYPVGTIAPGDLAVYMPEGYRQTQELAQWVHRIGFEGIIASSRYAGRAGDVLYIFGPAGENADFARLSGSEDALKLGGSIPGSFPRIISDMGEFDFE